VGATAHQSGLQHPDVGRVGGAGAVPEGLREEFISNESMGAVLVQGRRIPSAHLAPIP